MYINKFITFTISALLECAGGVRGLLTGLSCLQRVQYKYLAKAWTLWSAGSLCFQPLQSCAQGEPAIHSSSGNEYQRILFTSQQSSPPSFSLSLMPLQTEHKKTSMEGETSMNGLRCLLYFFGWHDLSRPMPMADYVWAIVKVWCLQRSWFVIIPRCHILKALSLDLEPLEDCLLAWVCHLKLTSRFAFLTCLVSPLSQNYALPYNRIWFWQIQGIANPLVLSLIAGIIPGWAYDTLQRHNRLGPRLILLLGGFIHFVGYVGLWAVGTHIIPQPHYWVVVSLGVIAMNGATWTDVACVSANVRSFPMDRGTAIGSLTWKIRHQLWYRPSTGASCINSRRDRVRFSFKWESLNQCITGRFNLQAYLYIICAISKYFHWAKLCQNSPFIAGFLKGVLLCQCKGYPKHVNLMLWQSTTELLHDMANTILAGILKSMMGLSASVFTVIYAVTIRPHSISFILVIALFLPVLSILAFPFFNAVPFRQKGELASHGEIWSNGTIKTCLSPLSMFIPPELGIRKGASWVGCWLFASHAATRRDVIKLAVSCE